MIIDRNDFVAEQVIGMIDTCRRLSIKVSILPDAVESLGPSVEVDAVEGVTLLGVNPPVLGRTAAVHQALLRPRHRDRDPARLRGADAR